MPKALHYGYFFFKPNHLKSSVYFSFKIVNQLFKNGRHSLYNGLSDAAQLPE